MEAMAKQEVLEASANSCQRIWDLRVATVVQHDLFSRYVSEVNVARMKAAGAHTPAIGSMLRQ